MVHSGRNVLPEDLVKHAKERMLQRFGLILDQEALRAIEEITYSPECKVSRVNGTVYYRFEVTKSKNTIRLARNKIVSHHNHINRAAAPRQAVRRSDPQARVSNSIHHRRQP